MQTERIGSHVYLALVLAVAAALLSGQRPGALDLKTQLMTLVASTTEAMVDAGSIGENPERLLDLR